MGTKNRKIGKQMLAAMSNPESVSMNALSVVLLGANESRRRKLASALAGSQARVVGEAAGSGLPGRDALPALLNPASPPSDTQDDADVLIVDLHEDPDRGLELVEAACGIDPTDHGDDLRAR